MQAKYQYKNNVVFHKLIKKKCAIYQGSGRGMPQMRQGVRQGMNTWQPTRRLCTEGAATLRTQHLLSTAVAASATPLLQRIYP